VIVSIGVRISCSVINLYLLTAVFDARFDASH